MTGNKSVAERFTEASKVAFDKLADALGKIEPRHIAACEEAEIAKAFEKQHEPTTPLRR